MDENDFEEMWDRMDDIEQEEYNKLMKSCCKQCEQCAYYAGEKIEFENIEPVSACIFTKDGEKVMDISQIKEVNIETNSKYEYNKPYESPLLTKWNSSMSIEIDNQILGTDLLKHMGIDYSRMPDKCDIEFMKPVQARKHHKKRINKKWLKRYGYKMINIQSKGWKVKHHANGTFKFSKKGGYEELANN